MGAPNKPAWTLRGSRPWMEQEEGWLCVRSAGSCQGRYVQSCFHIASPHPCTEIESTPILDHMLRASRDHSDFGHMCEL